VASTVGQIGKRQLEIGEGDPSMTRRQEAGQIARAPPDPEGQRRRQPGEPGRQAADERYAERRRRSRTSSTAIGMSESRMTIPTTMWM
jgi:hypothetical protein